RARNVTGVQTCALPILQTPRRAIALEESSLIFVTNSMARHCDRLRRCAQWLRALAARHPNEISRHRDDKREEEVSLRGGRQSTRTEERRVGKEMNGRRS